MQEKWLAYIGYYATRVTLKPRSHCIRRVRRCNRARWFLRQRSHTASSYSYVDGRNVSCCVALPSVAVHLHWHTRTVTYGDAIRPRARVNVRRCTQCERGFIRSKTELAREIQVSQKMRYFAIDVTGQALKIGVFAPTGFVWTKISSRRGGPHQPFFLSEN